MMVDRRIFGGACISLSAGMILSWIAFLNVAPYRYLRGGVIFMIPFITGLVAFACFALAAVGISSLIPERRRSIVLVRGGLGVEVSGGRRRSPSRGRRGAARILLASAPLIFLSASTILSWGWTPLGVVTSGSMSPTLNVGDLIVIAKDANVRRGDIIVFCPPAEDAQRSPVVHRVVEVLSVEGGRAFRTRGDANQHVDPWLIREGRVLGKVVFKVPLLGYPVLYMRNSILYAAAAALLFASPLIYEAAWRLMD